MPRIVISSGHGLHVAGATGYLNEVDEARRVVNRVADLLDKAGVNVVTFHDNTSSTQSENLDTIVAFHNAQGPHDLDVSVHFNAGGGSGTEVLYVTQEDLADELSGAIAEAAGWPNRGGKYRGDLAFLNGTLEPAILVEVCFVDSQDDAGQYHARFEAICRTIAEVIGDIHIGDHPEQPPTSGMVSFTGRCSWFGGPQDLGVSADEGLAFCTLESSPHLFLAAQPAGTTGLARRLNPEIFYVACRWDYSVTSKETLANPSRQALVSARGLEFLAWPADWGPHEDTGRVADLSPGLMDALGITTDDVVEVFYPAPQG